jgi:L,D-peptidoglycan transpeptidase YkuD (ErfK/YbiS/YcfS/YnhG family)
MTWPWRVIAAIPIAATVMVLASTVAASGISLAAKPGGDLVVKHAARRPSATSLCPHDVAQSLVSARGARQLIVVESESYTTSRASLSAWRLSGGCWRRQFGPWPARIGYAGFSNHKVEGDGTTPIGIFAIRPQFYGNAANPGVRFAYHRLVCGDWWDEDPSTHLYNEFVHVPCGTSPPFGGESEALWRETLAYPIFAVIDYNSSPVVPGRGSAIFLHASVGAPTSGCVSVPLSDLDALLRWLQPRSDPVIVLGPAPIITRY